MSRAALDGMLTVSAAGISPEYVGLQRASKFWYRHPPTQPPAGTNTATPFSVDGREPRFLDAALYDSITLAATAIDACLKDGCRPVGHGYEGVMPYFRAASIDGVAGPASIKVGSNDPQGRLFAVKVGKDPANRGVHAGAGEPYTFHEVAVTSTISPDLEVCVGVQLGVGCANRASPPGAVKCFASSATSIGVEWEASPPQGQSGLLSGYRVTAFALNEVVVAVVNSSGTRATFTTGNQKRNAPCSKGAKCLKFNLVYSVQVEALYANASIESKAAMCIIPRDGLPCIPPISLTPAATATSVDDRGVSENTNDAAGGGHRKAWEGASAILSTTAR